MSFEPEHCAALLIRLGPREREVLAKIADGLTRKEIADRLGISRSTVANHQCSLYRKLRVQGAVQATRVYLAGLAVVRLS